MIEIVVEPQVVEVTVNDAPVDVTVNPLTVEINPTQDIVEITVNAPVVEVVPENRIVDVIAVGLQGPQGIRGETGPSGSGGFNMTAGETLNSNSPIKVNADGFAYMASNLTADDFYNVVGISQTSALIGEEVTITRGELHESGWNWVLGGIYVGDKVLTQTPPTDGFVQIIATAISPVDIIGILHIPVELVN